MLSLESGGQCSPLLEMFFLAMDPLLERRKIKLEKQLHCAYFESYGTREIKVFENIEKTNQVIKHHICIFFRVTSLVHRRLLIVHN